MMMLFYRTCDFLFVSYCT